MLGMVDIVGQAERPVAKFSLREKAKQHLRSLTGRSGRSSSKNRLEAEALVASAVLDQQQSDMGTTAVLEPQPVDLVTARNFRSSFAGKSAPEEGGLNAAVPEEFVCPISGKIMADPVIVGSGQTYERSCIRAWFTQGRRECYKTGMPLEHQVLISNVALKTAIQKWCDVYRVPRPEGITAAGAEELVQSRLLERVGTEETSTSPGQQDCGDESGKPVIFSPVRYVHSASGASLRTEFGEVSSRGAVPHPLDTSPSSLLEPDGNRPEHGESSSTLDANAVAGLAEKLAHKHAVEQKEAAAEVRKLARDGAANRRALCQQDLLEVLVRLLHSQYPDVQVNSVAALLNLSLEKENKLKIARAGAIPALIHVLRAGRAEAQEHAAGAIFSLALHEENRLAIGVLGAIPPLIHVLRTAQRRAQQDASMALYYLSLAQLNRSKMVKAGLVPIILSIAEEQQQAGAGDVASRALCILSCLAASQEGRTALLEANGVARLLALLSPRAKKADEAELKEHAVATLLHLSHHNIRFKHLALQAGALELLVSLLDSATPRAKEKIVALVSILKDPPSSENSRTSTSMEPHYPRAYIRRGAAAARGDQNMIKAESSHF